MLGLGLGLVIGLYSALLDMFWTWSPMFDRLQSRNNRHGLSLKVLVSTYHSDCSA